MKKVLTAFIALVIFFAVLLSCFLVSAAAEEGNCGENVVWSFNSDDGELVISGTGEMADYSFDNMPWYAHRSSIKNIVIEEGVTYIGNYAFYKHEAVCEITLASTVRGLGENAFAFCTALEEPVTIPEGVTEISYALFKHCESLKPVVLPSTLKTIGYDGFYYCPALESITLPEGLTSIGRCAFQENKSLKSINIPDSVTSIADYAFESSGLTEFEIGKNSKLTKIGYTVFGDCRELSLVSLNGGVTEIGGYAFRDCDSLSMLILPKTVKTINDAFYGCTTLNSVCYYGSYSDWNKITINSNNTAITDARIFYDYDPEVSFLDIGIHFNG